MKIQLLLLCSVSGLCFWFPVQHGHCSEQTHTPVLQQHHHKHTDHQPVIDGNDEQNVFISEVESSSVSSGITDLNPVCRSHECLLSSYSHPEPPNRSEKRKTHEANRPEEIPTFEEWTKIMMEAQITHSRRALSRRRKKLQQPFTNYASVECGAKNPVLQPRGQVSVSVFQSTSAFSDGEHGHVHLNPCNNKIWFIIELCQPIQVKQLDIANFEIFSSNPKDFLVSISDRYPNKKWLKLGTFHARDERTVQSFPLDEHLFAKYIKMFTKYIKVSCPLFTG
ncbi:hypothetical protein QQF64_014267 [Cirrhinus molitorella]|uniref:SUN domain-containing protein n=1 Tax=Cirrhinus molitorella TaxID=172907 RepID=A0ABR3NS31_9TELE